MSLFFAFRVTLSPAVASGLPSSIGSRHIDGFPAVFLCGFSWLFDAATWWWCCSRWWSVMKVHHHIMIMMFDDGRILMHSNNTMNSSTIKGVTETIWNHSQRHKKMQSAEKNADLNNVMKPLYDGIRPSLCSYKLSAFPYSMGGGRGWGRGANLKRQSECS